MDPTVYQNIITPEGIWLRMFVLLPGPPTAQLSGKLLQSKADCDAHGVDRFEALSYTWGSPTHKGPVAVNGRVCLLGGNLYAALLALRYEDRPRILWIDAICINQDDIDEKNMHVPQMHYVYQRASRVVIWLGRAFEDSDLAFAHVDMLCETGDVDDFAAKVASSGGLSDSDVVNGLIWRPLYTLFGLPWWRRMWVLQEAYFANLSESIVMCGNEIRPWSQVIIASDLLQFEKTRIRTISPQLPLTLYIKLLGSVANTLFEMRESPAKRSLWYALRNTARLRLATDPRDKIFALLNLLEKEEWPCEPDYSLDTAELYTRVALHFMRKLNSLAILSQCAVYDSAEEDKLLRKELARDHLSGLPSWVPDWTLIKMTVPLSGSHGIGSPEQTPLPVCDPPPFHMESDRILVVRGIISETIVKTAETQFRRLSYGLPTLSTDSGMEGFFETVRSLRAEIKPTDESHIDTEWALLTGQNGNKPAHEFFAIPDFSREDYVNYRKSGSLEPTQAFFNTADKRTMARRIAATSLGRLALVPAAADAGDCVAYLVSCLSGVLLRSVQRAGAEAGKQSDASTEYYRVIEEAYVEGCDAEAVLAVEQENIRELRLQ